MRLRPQISALVTLLLLVGLALWSIWMMQPPAPVPATAPLTEFSAERAFAHVQEIGRDPHAMGTPAHARVRTYLLDQLRALNLADVQVQETTIAHRRGGSVGYVYNLLGRLRGTKPGSKAVLMLAHYDSQPNARGAADDGSSVAAILETARALQQGGRLQNDVIFLLSDGEEYGLFGAQAFLKHPWAKNVGFVMNLEARGVSGPAMTFEISPQNGWSVEALAKAAPYPVASSLMYEVYRSLPNSSDFTVFRLADYAGINTAYIDGFVHYHKLTDSPQNLDLGSLQHHGSNLLGMTRHVANQSLDGVKAPDKVFFNTVGFHMVHYPMGLNGWLVGLLGIMLLAVLILSVRKGVATVWQTLAGMGLFLLIMLLVTVVFWPITVAVRAGMPPAYTLRILPESPFAFNYYINGIYGSDRFLVAYTLLTIGLVGLLIRLVLRWIRPYSLLMGVYALIYAVVVMQLFLLPAATYLFLFPLLFSVLGTGIVLALNLVKRDNTLTHTVLVGLSALPAVVLLSPLVRLLFVTFDLQMPFVVAVALLIVLLGLLLPIGFGIERALRWRNGPTAASVALGLGIIVTIWAVYAEQPSPQQPLHSQVSYYLDADAKKACWMSHNQTTDHWNKQFFANPILSDFAQFYPAGQSGRAFGQSKRLVNGAPTFPLAPPTAEILSDSSSATARTLRLRVKSPRGAAGFEIGFVTSDTADVQGLWINGEGVGLNRRPVAKGKGFYWQAFCHGLPLTKELTITVQTRPQTPLELVLYDQSMTLPEPLVRVSRPADVVYEQGAGSNQTVVRKAYRF
ncbi:MAG: M20/M25/M40 family metallo-hydrolase [Cytophagales bacterium]|nr:MAG: M20/M25/M40 family metallo-hydrolase [Cytophagales bacterium]